MPEIPCQSWLVSKSLFTRGIYLSVSRCKLLFWAMYEWKACSDFFLIGNALQILTCTQQYLSMPLGAVCTTIGYKNHMLACLRSSMFSWSKNSLSLDCLLVPKISKRRFFRDISNSFQWVTQTGLKPHQKNFFEKILKIDAASPIFRLF